MIGQLIVPKPRLKGRLQKSRSKVERILYAQIVNDDFVSQPFVLEPLIRLHFYFVIRRPVRVQIGRAHEQRRDAERASGAIDQEFVCRQENQDSQAGEKEPYMGWRLEPG